MLIEYLSLKNKVFAEFVNSQLGDKAFRGGCERVSGDVHTVHCPSCSRRWRV